jgi:stearoyl-CoA desaturase (delta-9 desaturase)
LKIGSEKLAASETSLVEPAAFDSVALPSLEPHGDPFTPRLRPRRRAAAHPRRRDLEPARRGADPKPDPERGDGPPLVWPRPRSIRWSRGLEWANVLWIGLLHVGALAAPFWFSWQGLAAVAVLAWVTGGLGICLGYHRLLTHASFKTYAPLRWFFAFLGGLAGEGPPITWVATHRKHHAFSDTEGDPHSPNDGKWWSHMLWLAPRMGPEILSDMNRRYAPDLLRDGGIRFLQKTFLLWHFALGAGLLALGWLCWDAYTGVSLLLWGLFVRLVWVLHVTWLVNSASHIWGYRNYQTSDNSRNLWWVGLLAYGEGWHNNHHAFQRMARHGHRWWEIDMTYWAICALERLGLAWNVVHTTAGAHAAPGGPSAKNGAKGHCKESAS